jgi:hypothetical protein
MFIYIHMCFILIDDQINDIGDKGPFKSICGRQYLFHTDAVRIKISKSYKISAMKMIRKLGTMRTRNATNII